MRLIDADRLHERIAHACIRRRKMPGGVDDLFADGLEYAEDMLLNAPTVDEERHGKWVNVNGDYSEALEAKLFLTPRKRRFAIVQTAAQKWRHEHANP